MNTELDLGKMRIETGVARVFDHYSSGGSMFAGSGARKVSTIIKFGRKFRGDPVVHISIAALHHKNNHDLRHTTVVTNITNEDFEVTTSTWSDTKIALLSINWMAIGKDTS